MAKRRKGLDRTDYAVRNRETGSWLRVGEERGWKGREGTDDSWRSFKQCTLFTARPRATEFPGCEIVDVRCHPLSTRTKASKKRTE